MFTAKHYERVAVLLLQLKPIDTPANVSEYNQWIAITRAFARMFAGDNENFKPAKFFRACGYPMHDDI